ncbi:MAG: hypothetical protein Q7J60_25620, partial [Bradyrhizobium sp.]|nr:hypothetical protein [Bradyrhizobium sp.]
MFQFLTKPLGSAKAAHGHGEIGMNSGPATHPQRGNWNHLPQVRPGQKAAIFDDMKVEDIAEAVARLPPDELKRLRRLVSEFEEGRPDHTDELNS